MKMNKIALLLIICFISTISFAQDEANKKEEGWKKGGLVTLNFTQVTLHNWAAGGENSLSGVGFVNLFANYKKNRMTWDNTIDLGYGLLKQGEGDIMKSDDKIEISSKYGQYAFEHWYYSGLVSFKSQFATGYQKPGDANKISDFMAPGYLNIAIGMDYKPNDNLTVLISPLTGKTTFLSSPYLSSIGAYGVEPGKNIRFEFGAYIKAAYKVDIMKNIGFQTKIDLFTNYLNKPENIDVNWESLLSLKVNDYISASVFFMLIYDDDIRIPIDKDGDGIADYNGPRTQLKEMFGLGLSYKF